MQKKQRQHCDSVFPTQLVNAYETAEYHVETEPPIVLRVNEPNAALVELLATRSVSSCAFITACNPFGQLLPTEENLRRNMALQCDLQSHAPALLPARGVAPDGCWPDEPGFLVLGCSQEVLEAIGRRHRQNALVVCGSDGTPKLALLRWGTFSFSS